MACAASGRVALPSGGRVLLGQAEYEALKATGGREYAFTMPSGDTLMLLDLADPGASLGEKVPRRTEGPEPDIALPPGWELPSLRSLLPELPPEEFKAALRATHLIQWRRRTRYCPHCATPLRESREEFALECPACSLLEFPRISPAIIVLIERKGRIVLARNASFTQGMHSLIAGFVEAGESMEEAVVREAREEIGIELGGLRYFGSQGWPFPDSLMVGFLAEAASPDLKPDGVEIVEAGWFGPDNLPPIPRRGSIARAMIDAWLAERGFKTEL
jgi:NAD+ diphosphatase